MKESFPRRDIISDVAESLTEYYMNGFIKGYSKCIEDNTPSVVHCRQCVNRYRHENRCTLFTNVELDLDNDFCSWGAKDPDK